MEYTLPLEWWLLPTIVFSSAFLIVSNIYAILDYTQFTCYKNRCVYTKTDNYKALTFKVWLRVIANDIRNIVLAFLFGYILWFIRSSFSPNSPRQFKDENIILILAQLFLCYIWAELWFWTSHFLVHKYLPSIHKQHHEFVYTYAIVGFYSSVGELLIINLPLSTYMCILLKCHPVTQSIWLFVLGTHICLNHSAHQLLPKRFDDVSYHAQHHILHNIHYGAGWVEKRLL